VTVTIYGEGGGSVLLSVKEFTISVTQTDVDCGYSDWGQYSTCDKPCDGGRQTRSRSIVRQPLGSGAKCVFSDQLETQSCNQQACLPPTINQVMDVTISQDSGSSYVDLTGISAGQGERGQGITISVESNNPNLVRFQSNDIMYRSPSTSGMLWFAPNPGQSGSTRVTVSVMDSGTSGGNVNSYTTVMTYTINVVPLPVDCVTEFTAFGACSTTCGEGVRTREMRVKRQSSANGRPCPSPMPRETETCSSGACPMPCVKAWSEYQACSVTCGTGVKTRYETIVSFPQNGGESCGNLDTQQRPCQQRNCPVDCVTSFSDWSVCSVSCGTGVQTRQMVINTPASGQTQYLSRIFNPPGPQYPHTFPQPCSHDSRSNRHSLFYTYS
jgi:hypothetical protein